MSGAKELYSELEVARQSALAIARECSKLTIPSLLPPDGTNTTTVLPQPYQSLGAYGVNNLASKLLLALYPPGNAFFRYILPEQIAADAAQMPEDTQAELQKKLASIENRVIQRFEASTIRPAKAEAILHLVVAGNVLTKFETLDKYRLYRLDQYVCRRSAAGAPLDVVVKECVPTRDLSDEIKAACKVDPNAKEAEVYTAVTWKNKRCEWRQEINDVEVPDSRGDSPTETSPWNALRWKAVPGSDYGRGHCEEYLGDLQSLEGLSQSNVEYAALCAKVVLLVKPGSATNVEDINKARSGDAVAGSKDDVGAFQLDKYADFKVVEMALQRLEERLSRAFLIRSGMVRDAERVTAEEIRDIAQELEDTLGGVYTVQSQEEQMPFVRRLLTVLTESRDIPLLPPGTVEPVIVTGFQALGRNHALNKLRGALQDVVNLFGPEGAAQMLNATDIITRIFLGWGVEDASSAVKSQQQLVAERAQQVQAQTMQTMLEKGTGPAISAVAQTQAKK